MSNSINGIFRTTVRGKITKQGLIPCKNEQGQPTGYYELSLSGAKGGSVKNPQGKYEPQYHFVKVKVSEERISKIKHRLVKDANVEVIGLPVITTYYSQADQMVKISISIVFPISFELLDREEKDGAGYYDSNYGSSDNGADTSHHPSGNGVSHSDDAPF